MTVEHPTGDSESARSPTDSPRPGSDPPFAARGLTKRFGSTLALDSLDLIVERGEVFGFLGPNGAGKTTTIRLMLGLIRPTAGTARIFGHDAWRDPVRGHRHVAYVSGDPMLWPALTGRETLEFLENVFGHCDRAYRDELIDRFAFDPSKRVRSYSQGNRQKLQLIAALMTRADLLVLDEPTIGLDPLMEQVFRHCILEARDRGQTVFLSSHVLSEVEAVCSRVALLRGGRLIDLGTLGELGQLSSVAVEAVYRSAPPDLTGVAGVGNVDVSDHTVRCNVTGEVGPAMRALARDDLVHLLSHEPSLEELFLSHYSDAVEHAD